MAASSESAVQILPHPCIGEGARCRRLEVFGSAARGADFDPVTSDADLLVSFQNDSARASLSRFFDLTEVLEGMLGRTVDLISPDALTNPYVVASVNRAREVIYGA